MSNDPKCVTALTHSRDPVTGKVTQADIAYLPFLLSGTTAWSL